MTDAKKGTGWTYNTGLFERAGAGGQWPAGQTTLVYGISVLGGQRPAGQTTLVYGISLLEMERSTQAISTQKALLVS